MVIDYTFNILFLFLFYFSLLFSLSLFDWLLDIYFKGYLVEPVNMLLDTDNMLLFILSIKLECDDENWIFRCYISYV